MNGQQFRAFLWLRWRLRVNQIRRGGTANAVILAVLAAVALFASLALFVGALFAGPLVLSDATPAALLVLWDVLVVGFLFVWCVALLADLQRSEVLSLEKVLYLPVSPTGAFLINYLSSLVNLRLILFVPALVGLVLGLALARGPALLLALPLLAAFLLMVTALTNQFQGWLAALMMNPRRRRAMIVFVTLGIVLVGQVPNLIVNVVRPRVGRARGGAADARVREQTALLSEAAAGRITPEELARRSAAIEQKYRDATQPQSPQATPDVRWSPEMESALRIASTVLPPGWLPLGVMGLAEGSPLPALLGTAGLALIGTASLWRSYRTTVRLYTGQFRSGKARAVAAKPRAKAERVPLLEWRLPGVSEPSAAVALASVRWLMRAPEAKLMLLGPVIMIGILGSMTLTRTDEVAPALRPLMAFGATGMAMLGLIGFVGNQFGFDRNGFRVFVLSGTRRRDILLGKNLALAPVTLGIGLAAVTVLQCVYPMPADLFLAAVAQFVAMYLIVCLLGNLLSILAPMPIAPGTLRPARPKAIHVLLQVVFALLFPVVLAPTLLPLGVEALLHWLGVLRGVPVCLLLTLAECALVGTAYHFVLNWEGDLLQLREQKILDAVTPKAE